VALWSRVTGYLQSVDGFNSAKKQEVKDRHRTSNQELLA
jgi:anaerobic ribonucleoside-triphosphate reductase